MKGSQFVKFPNAKLAGFFSSLGVAIGSAIITAKHNLGCYSDELIRCIARWLLTEHSESRIRSVVWPALKSRGSI
jgi:hypothetical protein